MYEKGGLYPEITAYAISLCSILYKRKEDRRFLERAEDCAEYMTGLNSGGGIPHLGHGAEYTFDTGIYVSAILDLYGLTENEAHKIEASKRLRWLVPMLDGEVKASVPKTEEGRWYNRPSVHLSKMAIPLLKASACFDDEGYERIALDLLDRYRELQTELGNFLIGAGSDRTLIHPHCYATEAFLYAYHNLKDPGFLDIANSSLEWLSEAQNGDGSFYDEYVYDPETGETCPAEKNVKRTDAVAQAARLWKMTGANEGGVERAYDYLESQLRGGLRLFRGSLWDRVFPKVYSWPTFFYIHSLTLPFGDMDYVKELF